jgi:eukaryotic-like serine/threonine-protein kinase
VTTPRESGAASRPPLTPDTWKNAKAIFLSALELSPEERASFVRKECGQNVVMFQEVESLLAASDETPSSFDVPALVRLGVVGGDAMSAEHDLMSALTRAVGDKYALERELGGGGMSRVFLATDRKLGRKIVIKVLSPGLAQEMSADRFAREVRLAAKLQHPNIVALVDADTCENLPYYTMQYVSGGSLRARIAKGSVPPGEGLGYLKDIAKALKYAHRKGVIHRDIKPDNVLLSDGTAVVTDFGIAKAISAARVDDLPDEKYTARGTSIGTPEYMSPEQAVAEPTLDERSDIYSFGILAYELLAGVHPFADKRSRSELIAAHLMETPREIAEVSPDIPASLARLVMRCIAKPKEDRFSNGVELSAALENIELGRVSSVDTAPRSWDAEALSIAVLPFANLSPDPENEYFSDGITAEVVSALTHVRGLRVKAGTSSFAFKGQAIDLATIARRLGVEMVLEGSVRKSGVRVRISVQLLNTADGSALWGDRYDRELSDIFAVQDEIASAIANALRRTLSSAGHGHVTPGAPTTTRVSVNAEAFELYLRGRMLVEQRAEGMHEAMRCFDRAIHIDPGFSLPHAGLAYGFNLFGIYYALRAHEAFPQSRSAADRALQIDSSDVLALVMRAHAALWYEWDREKAASMASRALELAPAFYLAHDCIGFVRAAQGRFEDAIAAMQSARELDPLSDYATYDLGWVLILARRWKEAIRELRKAVARHPESSEMHRVYGFALFHSGQHREALAEFRTILELNPAHRWGPANLAQGLAACGDTAAARRIVSDIEERVPHEPMPLVGLAIAHHWLGDDDAALAWLERAIEARDYWLVMLRHDPSMNGLRGDPRYEALMKRVVPDHGQ